MWPVLLLLVSAVSAVASPLVSTPGHRAVIPGWHIQSERHVSSNLSYLSLPGLDVSSWHRVGPRTTVMAGLIEAGVYNETIFFSENLQAVPEDDFRDVSWLYRRQFSLQPSKEQHYLLQTHGITSRADIYLNGVQVVSNNDHAGSYVGHLFDITPLVQRENVLLIKAHPTNYLRDLAVGFIDWNPYPADNGTGVWRDVELATTGAVHMSDARVVTDYNPGKKHVKVTVKVDVRNYGKDKVKGEVRSSIDSHSSSVRFELRAGEEKTLSTNILINDAMIWWPAAWGPQHLYTLKTSTWIDGQRLSDTRTRRFGIRHVSSQVNAHDSIQFHVNGQPFFVMGAGYTSDIFLRFDPDRIRTILRYVLDMGMNTVRLEGKLEHPSFYDLADEMGVMVIAGWECCDHWEGWTYNKDGFGELWKDADYPIARDSMLHESVMMQGRPSILGFLVGSDYWPNEQATDVYLDALKRMDWSAAIIASAAKRGFPPQLGSGGMKMDGPYDWVPPVYWWGDKLGAAGAGGFGSELGAGVGTPGLRSLKKFLSDDDLKDLWTRPDKALYHMSAARSQFKTRDIYHKALVERYGEVTGLDDYMRKASVMDYEATRAEYESYAARSSDSNPTTGLIYWMLNSAWPSLHWALFDYYMTPMAAYFGTKVGARTETVALDLSQRALYIINHSLSRKGARHVSVDIVGLDGKSTTRRSFKTTTVPNSSKKVGNVPDTNSTEVVFLRVLLKDDEKVLSRNIYWLPPAEDVLEWDNSTWYHTPVRKYADLSSLNNLRRADVSVHITPSGRGKARVVLESKSSYPAFFLRLALLDKDGEEVTPVFWDDNYVTLFPGEHLEVDVNYDGDAKAIKLEVEGWNVPKTIIQR